VTKLPGRIRQQQGEPNAAFAIRLAAQNAVLESELIALARTIEGPHGILRAWAEDAPLSEERREHIEKAHGRSPNRPRFEEG